MFLISYMYRLSRNLLLLRRYFARMRLERQIIVVSHFLGIFIYLTNCQNGNNFILEKTEPCTEIPKVIMNLTVTPRTFKTPQLVDIHLFTPIPMDNTMRASLDVELETKLKVMPWQRIILLEDDLCRIFRVYMGEFFYDMQRAVGIPRGACPVPKGYYHALNYTINTANLKLQLPPGKTLTVFKVLRKPKREVLLCIKYFVSNS